QQLIRGGGYAYAKVDDRAPLLSDGREIISVYARIPATHQEALSHFDEVRVMDVDQEHVCVMGNIRLSELALMLGDGRDGFQVIALPHLSGPKQDVR
ncbi:MAG: hypothetical protein ABI373_08955, partial [Flavobacteriales bacterium]